MNTQISKKWIGGAALVAMIAIPAAVAARGVPAIALFAQPADASCFAQSLGGRVVNTCPTQRRAYLPLPVDTTGAHTVTVTAKRPTASSTVHCRSVAIDWSGNSSAFSLQSAVTTVGAWQTLSLSAVTVPASGALMLICDVDPNGEIGVASYTP